MVVPMCHKFLQHFWLFSKSFYFINFIFENIKKIYNVHCVKSVRIRSYSGPHFSHIFLHSDWIRGGTEYTFYALVNVSTKTPTQKFRIMQFAIWQYLIMQLARKQLSILQYATQKFPIMQFAIWQYLIMQLAR